MMGIYVISMIFAGLGMLVSWRLKSKFQEYSQIGLSNGLSGREVAQKMLKENGIYDVQVVSVDGQLTDHYNPADKTVNLSPDVYEGRSVSAAAVAAHECGHAVQHATAYSMLQLRSTLVPMTNITSKFTPYILMFGVMLMYNSGSSLLLLIGIGLFSVATLFSLVTLPVEFDASRRALDWIQANRVVNDKEYVMAKDALWWAAMTYVVAALGMLAQLLYYVSMLNRRNN
jgi:uncharacterized protein